MGRHEWRERTEDGDVRFVRCTRQASAWRFQEKLKSSEDGWMEIDPMPLEDLESLREILFNKYQRRRVPSEQVAEIDAMIKAAEDPRGL